MDELFEKYMNVGGILTQDHNYTDAVEAYHKAMALAPSPELKIDVCNKLGQLYQWSNNNEMAVRYFKKSIDFYANLEKADSPHVLLNMAGIYNNLGSLSLHTDVAGSMHFHKKALTIIENLFEENERKYIHHLTNTLYALASNYMQADDDYQAVKYFRKIIDLVGKCTPTELEQMRPILASTYFQMGNLKSDQNKEEEARTMYHKSLHHYEKLEELHPHKFLPYLASVQNNLAVVNRLSGYIHEARKYYEKTIDSYAVLSQIDEEMFLPYHAASLNALGNMYADDWTPEDDLFSGSRGFLTGFGMLGSSSDQGHKSGVNPDESDIRMAEQYYGQSLELYQKLADNHPEEYTHYIAMILHNLGVLYDEKKEFKKAENFYLQALQIRKRLAGMEPDSFNKDVCITQMNLVTLYQTMMEREVNLGYRDICLELLEDTRSRLAKSSDEITNRSFQNLLGDLDYFTGYFSEISEADLVANVLKDSAGKLHDDALSDRDLSGRIKYYREIMDLYHEALSKYPDHEKLLESMENYLPIFISTSLSVKEVDLADGVLKKFISLLPGNELVHSQKGLLYLVTGNYELAGEVYRAVRESKNAAGDDLGQRLVEQADDLGLKFN